MISLLPRVWRPALAAGLFVVCVGANALASDTPAAPAQPRPAPQFGLEEQKAAMAKLQYMAGNWQGKGWMMRPGGRVEFRGGEVVQSKLGGIALLVEGSFFHRDEASGQEVPSHTTLGVISFDPKAKVYRFRTWLATGSSGDHELHVTETGWWWEISTPMGRIRYTTTFTDDTWSEIGERIADIGEPRKFFEMQLQRAAKE